MGKEWDQISFASSSLKTGRSIFAKKVIMRFPGEYSKLQEGGTMELLNKLALTGRNYFYIFHLELNYNDFSQVGDRTQ